MVNDEKKDTDLLEKIKTVKDLQQSEATLHWQRNGFFLLASSILLIAVGQFHTNIIGLAFGILGVVMNSIWLSIQYRSSEYIREWKAQVEILQADLQSSAKLDLFTSKAKGIQMRFLAMLLPLPFIMIWCIILVLSIYGLVNHIDMIPANSSK